ncbi:hypothetical protein E2G42_20560, partial [Salmonella enterica subsp. enterica]|nr:hypothetical protein [Salmonella enterica subsp. enterica]
MKFSNSDSKQIPPLVSISLEEERPEVVKLLVSGRDVVYPPSHAGVITVYDDSKPGTL